MMIGMIVVVRISTDISQLRSDGYSPGLANQYACIEINGISDNNPRRITAAHLNCSHSYGPYMDMFSLLGPVSSGNALIQ